MTAERLDRECAQRSDADVVEQVRGPVSMSPIQLTTKRKTARERRDSIGCTASGAAPRR